MNCDNVGLTEKVLLGDELSACVLSLLRCQILAPADRIHAERFPDRCGALAEPAKAKNTERQAFEIPADRHLPGFACLESRIFESDPPGQFQHQAKGNTGRWTADSASTAHGNPALGAGLDIERIIAGPGRDEELQ